MKIKQVLNNNVVTVSENNKELVVMGRGLAFQKRSGDELDEAKVEKVFALENKEISEKLISLIREIPIKYVELSEEIIKYAESEIGKKLNDNIYLTLTDHISFALTRHKQGHIIKNPMVWEIKRFYRQEYAIGIKALEMIKKYFGVDFAEDEAASIALHIVNSNLNEDMPNTFNITKIIQDILNIIKYHFDIEFDEESLSYHRLVTHLKFFAQRILNDKLTKSDDEYLYGIIKEKCPKAFECAVKIKEYIKATYNFQIGNEEMTYLTIHIERVVSREQ